MAFRPRLSADSGLPLFVVLSLYSESLEISQLLTYFSIFHTTRYVRFGSLAIVQDSTTPMSAFGCIADVQSPLTN